MTIAEWYLTESGGNAAYYRKALAAGQRIGQAFFNALTGDDQERLRGTLADPFHKDGNGAVAGAVDFLTAPGGGK